jgi:hypothetical protein
MKPKFYAVLHGKREDFETLPRNTYFAAGFYPEKDIEGNAFVHYIGGLTPLYKINGERYCRPEYAGKDLREIENFKP